MHALVAFASYRVSCSKPFALAKTMTSDQAKFRMPARSTVTVSWIRFVHFLKKTGALKSHMRELASTVDPPTCVVGRFPPAVDGT